MPAWVAGGCLLEELSYFIVQPLGLMCLPLKSMPCLAQDWINSIECPITTTQLLAYEDLGDVQYTRIPRNYFLRHARCPIEKAFRYTSYARGKDAT